MFARCTQFFAFSTALFAISGSLALAQNFPGPRQGPQIVTPQGDPPSLLNQQNGQFNGQFGPQNNGPASADLTPRLNPQYGQQQFAGPQQNRTPQAFQQRERGHWGHSHANHGQHQHHGQCARGCSHDRNAHAPFDSAHNFAPPPMPAGFQCQGGNCPHGGF